MRNILWDNDNGKLLIALLLLVIGFTNGKIQRKLVCKFESIHVNYTVDLLAQPRGYHFLGTVYVYSGLQGCFDRCCKTPQCNYAILTQSLDQNCALWSCEQASRCPLKPSTGITAAILISGFEDEKDEMIIVPPAEKTPIENVKVDPPQQDNTLQNIIGETKIPQVQLPADNTIISSKLDESFNNKIEAVIPTQQPIVESKIVEEVKPIPNWINQLKPDSTTFTTTVAAHLNKVEVTKLNENIADLDKLSQLETVNRNNQLLITDIDNLPNNNQAKQFADFKDKVDKQADSDYGDYLNDEEDINVTSDTPVIPKNDENDISNDPKIDDEEAEEEEEEEYYDNGDDADFEAYDDEEEDEDSDKQTNNLWEQSKVTFQKLQSNKDSYINNVLIVFLVIGVTIYAILMVITAKLLSEMWFKRKYKKMKKEDKRISA